MAHNIFWDFTILNIIILIYAFLIEFKFYSILKPSIKILTHDSCKKKLDMWYLF